MKALVLAAGRGTRMKELTANRPKPMVPVLGKPALEHILTNLRGAGAEEFVVVTGYRADVIEEYFGDGAGWGIKIRYMRQEVQNGNATAIHMTREAMSGGPFFLTFGDIMAPPSHYQRLAAEYAARPCSLLLSLIQLPDVSRGSSVVFDGDGRVLDIEEKPEPGKARSNWNSAAIFVADPVLFEYTGALQPSKRGEYELTDAIRAMIRDEKRLVRAIAVEGYWGDLADAEELAAMEEILREECRILNAKFKTAS